MIDSDFEEDSNKFSPYQQGKLQMQKLIGGKFV
jgi:hypothetical protein